MLLCSSGDAGMRGLSGNHLQLRDGLPGRLLRLLLTGLGHLRGRLQRNAPCPTLQHGT